MRRPFERQGQRRRRRQCALGLLVGLSAGRVDGIAPPPWAVRIRPNSGAARPLAVAAAAFPEIFGLRAPSFAAPLTLRRPFAPPPAAAAAAAVVAAAAKPTVVVPGSPPAPRLALAPVSDEPIVDNLAMLMMIAAFRLVVGHIVGFQAPQRFFGGETGESYRGLVEVSRKLLADSPEATTARVLGVLNMFPTRPSIFRANRFCFELMGFFTPFLFPFLVGRSKTEAWTHPSGEVWTTRVKIEKCRFLEVAECKGMCIGLCKMPTEAFFNNELGLPVSLLPDFEDGSCTMTWGEPATADDLADQDLSCYANCSMLGRAALSVAVRAHCADSPAPALARPQLVGPVRPSVSMRM